MNSSGCISVIGRTRSMQNAVVIEHIGGHYMFYAVYHGLASQSFRDKLHSFVDQAIQSQTYFHLDQLLSHAFRQFGSGIAGASVLLVGDSEVLLANSGDCRAVFCSSRGPFFHLSRHHKPDGVDDASGRRRNAVVGNSIGNSSLNGELRSEPEVTIWDRKELDGVAVIASNGLWDVMPNDFVAKVIFEYFHGEVTRNFTNSTANEASAMLAELAMARGSKDNISVVLVDLKGNS